MFLTTIDIMLAGLRIIKERKAHYKAETTLSETLLNDGAGGAACLGESMTVKNQGSSMTPAKVIHMNYKEGGFQNDMHNRTVKYQ